MVGLMTPKAIIVRQGDSFLIRIHLTKSDKKIDLLSTIGRMQVRDDSGNIMWELTGKIVSPDGKSNSECMCFQITPQQSNIEVGDYVCDIQLEMSDGSVNTIFPQNVTQIGTLRITGQVTK